MVVSQGLFFMKIWNLSSLIALVNVMTQLMRFTYWPVTSTVIAFGHQAEEIRVFAIFYLLFISNEWILMKLSWEETEEDVLVHHMASHCQSCLGCWDT